jgi:cell division transport system permease protein
MIRSAEADVEVSVFLTNEVSPAQQQHIGDLLTAMPEVKQVTYESKEQAYQHFIEIFKDQQSLAQNVTPDALPASFRVTLKDPKQFEVVAARLQGQPGIENIRDNRAIYNRLFAVTAVFRVGMFAVAVIMLVSAAALIGNTVRLAVFNRRKEIGIMRLVGATNWHIRLPFLIEGILEGVVGAGAAITALFIMKVAFIDPLRDKIQFVPWVNTPDVISTVIPLILASVLVSAIASMIAMRQFLEV